jgi:hypothetical protein
MGYGQRVAAPPDLRRALSDHAVHGRLSPRRGPGRSPGLLVIPFVWSLVGGSAALLLGIRIDLTLFAAGAGLLALAAARGNGDRPRSGSGARGEP